MCFYSLTDDQGFADVRYTNPNLPFQTENIDKLAARSIRLVCSSTRVSPTGVLRSDVVAKLKIDEFCYELWNSVKKIQCSLHKNKI